MIFSLCTGIIAEVYMETYRSGHNGADSKSVREQSHVGSNPTVSARKRGLLRNKSFATALFCVLYAVYAVVLYRIMTFSSSFGHGKADREETHGLVPSGH